MASRRSKDRHVADRVRRRIRELRKERGLTQEMLCERTSLSLGAINRIESGARVPQLDTLDRIASALGVRIGDLVDAETPRPAVRNPAALRSIIALLEREPAWVQKLVLKVARALVADVRKNA